MSVILTSCERWRDDIQHSQSVIISQLEIITILWETSTILKNCFGEPKMWLSM